MEWKRIRISLVALMVGGALAFAGAQSAWSETGVSSSEVVIGQSCTYSGPVGFMGRNTALGIKAYLKRVNAAGGVHGRKIKYISYDDGYQPPKSVANTKRLIDRDRVFTLFQSCGTPTVMAAYQYSRTKGVPMFLPNTFAHVLNTPLKKDILSLGADYADQVTALIDYLTKARGMKRIALFYQDDKYGAEGLRAAEKRLGDALIAKVSYKRNAVDFSPQAAKLKRANADGVVMMALAQGGSKVIREAVKIGYKPQWAGVNPMANKQLTQLGKEAVEGFIAAMPFPSEDSDVPGVIRYREDLKALDPGAIPQQPGLWGYTSSLVLVEALKRAGPNLTRAGLIKAAESIKNFKTGILPPISFSSSNHNGSRAVQIAQVKGGKFVYITDWR